MATKRLTEAAGDQNEQNINVTVDQGTAVCERLGSSVPNGTSFDGGQPLNGALMRSCSNGRANSMSKHRDCEVEKRRWHLMRR